eukprot:XP_008656347.1 uncharacterized protein LOC103635746 isoform X2 [Zea mays]
MLRSLRCSTGWKRLTRGTGTATTFTATTTAGSTSKASNLSSTANSEIGHLISEMSSHVHNICAVLNEAALEEILYQFEEKLQAEREEAARKQEELQAQLQAQQAALEENQSLLR